MKNMKHLLFFGLVSAVLMASHVAQAQVQYVAPGKTYTFSSDTAATGSGITYQWYRDGQPIEGATGESYTLPGNLAYGFNVVFIRGAVSSSCPGEPVYSNAFIITFCNGLFVGHTCWATTNVDFPSMFASRPDMYTQLYQWGRTVAWPATGNISGWNFSTADTSTWNPCPAGWRLPTQGEFQALYEGSVPEYGIWADANTKGNAVGGRFFGPNSATCTLPNNMTDCVFLPAVGFRNYGNGILSNLGVDANYWCSTVGSTSGYQLLFNAGGSSFNNVAKGHAMSIRCVQ